MTQVDLLSKREKEVVRLLLQGKGNKQIALALGISIRTVEFHLRNVYEKFQVSSRIELILKLGYATGNSLIENLVDSTVAQPRQIAKNRDERNLHSEWAASLKAVVSGISKEPEMKNRWILYSFAGLVFGAIYWHYFSITAKFFNDLEFNQSPPLSAGWLLVPALLVYFGVWLIPTILPAVFEFRQSASLRRSVAAVVTTWLCAVAGYYLNYLVMLALVGLPNMEYLVIFGQRTATLWQDWSSIFPRLIAFNFLKWVGISGLISGLAGFITSKAYASWSKKNNKLSPA